MTVHKVVNCRHGKTEESTEKVEQQRPSGRVVQQGFFPILPNWLYLEPIEIRAVNLILDPVSPLFDLALHNLNHNFHFFHLRLQYALQIMRLFRKA